MINGVAGILSATKNSPLADNAAVTTCDILKAIVKCESLNTLKIVQVFIESE